MPLAPRNIQLIDQQRVTESTLLFYSSTADSCSSGSVFCCSPSFCWHSGKLGSSVQLSFASLLEELPQAPMKIEATNIAPTNILFITTILFFNS